LFRATKTRGFDIEGRRIEDDVPGAAIWSWPRSSPVARKRVHARDGADGRGRLRPVLYAGEDEDVPLIEAFCAKREGEPNG